MDQNLQVAPWGDAVRTPCGCGQTSLLGWVQANPWLAAGLVAAVVLLFTSGGEKQ